LIIPQRLKEGGFDRSRDAPALAAPLRRDSGSLTAFAAAACF
jgi:hypothetical protein